MLSHSKCARIFSLAVFFFAFGIVSCTDDKKEKSPPPPDLTKFSGIYEIYLKSCAECHEPGNITYTDDVRNLDMSSEEAAYTSLLKAVDIKRNMGSGCAERKYVQEGSPSTSYLYAIMDDVTRDAFAAGSDAACTPKLHVIEVDASGANVGGVARKPAAEQKEAIRAWIEKGAPRN